MDGAVSDQVKTEYLRKERSRKAGAGGSGTGDCSGYIGDRTLTVQPIGCMFSPTPATMPGEGGNMRMNRVGRRVLAVVAAVGLVTCAVLAGVAETANLGAGSPSIAGDYLLPVFTAAFLGATQFRRGRFNPWGTVVAILLLGTTDGPASAAPDAGQAG